MFKQFQSLVEKQFNSTIKSFNSDWGGEYRPLHTYFKSVGILHRIASPHTHEQNGTAERKIRSIVDIGLALLAHSGTPFKYWEYAFETAVFLINRLPSTSLQNQILLTLLYKHQPDFSFLRIFGCCVYPLLRPYNRHKFDFRSKKCVFLGYSPHHLGYRCLDKESGRIYVSRHVQFDERVFPFHEPTTYRPSSRTTSPGVPLLQLVAPLPPFTRSLDVSSGMHSVPSEPNMSYNPTTTQVQQPILSHSLSDVPTSSSNESITRSPSTSPIPHFPSPPRKTHHMVLRPNPKPKVLLAEKLSPPQTEPLSFIQAIKFPEWKTAMESEMLALNRNQTWDLVPPPNHGNVVGNRWIFKIKRKADGSIDRYKARLVARGFTQEYGLDYNETFSPVVKPITIRVVLSVAVSRGWKLNQLDVSNAFLNGELQETVYMVQPQGFVNPSFPHYVCRLRKSIYGLKQSPRTWFQRLSKFLFTLGFRGSNADSSLFIYKNSGCVIYLLVYVDDIIITGSDNNFLTSLISRLSQEFKLRDLGDLHYFLGIQVIRHNDGLILSQHKYFQDILKLAGMESSKPCSTPLTAGLVLSKSACSALSQNDSTLYRRLCGSYSMPLLRVLIYHLLSTSFVSSCTVPPLNISRLLNVFFGS